MTKQIERIGFLPTRALLVAMMGFLVLVCFAQPAAPEISIEIVTEEDGDYVHLSWGLVEGADSYNIYATDNLENWGDPVATVEADVTQYTVSVGEEILRYYYVTAYREAVIPAWLVLVYGDLYNGVVTIDPFYISKYQVTQQDFLNVMPVEEWNFVFGGNPSHPAEMVSWFDAVEYCNRLSISEGLEPVYAYNDRTNPDDWYAEWPDWNNVGTNHTNVSADWEANGYRLPTEAEWHHAANEATHPAPFIYSGSDNIDEVAWYSDNSGETTHPVGTKSPNSLGIYDMTGNVFEWCWDRYVDSWGSNSRMARGGSWNRGANFCTLAYVSERFNAHVRGERTGFRVSP